MTNDKIDIKRAVLIFNRNQLQLHSIVDQSVELHLSLPRSLKA